MRTLKDYLQSINFNKKPNNIIINIINQQYNSINNKDSEEQVKKYIDAMITAFQIYKTILDESNIDLTVHNNRKLVAIFECKSLQNKTEMLEYADLNKKALWELIANFLPLEKTPPDYLIATNGKEWFVFENGPFIRFANNNNAQQYCGFSQRVLPFLTKQTRKEFYEHIENFFKINPEILKDFSNHCIYLKSVDEVYFFLSPDIFLRQYNPNIGNTLNRGFYDELLYILGLKEEEKQGKKTIVPNGVANTFYSQIFSQTNDFEKTLELMIIWLNRILFLKLFEARLVAFNNNPSFKFLNKSKIPDTTALEKLFFNVLAVPEGTKGRAYDCIPYLNSSLFEEKELEKSMPISKISGNDSVNYFKDTVLKENTGKQRTGSTTLLDYLFDFLDAYNFGEEGDPSSLISPAVLGLIFEKINGYKEGSHYTPTTITDYMAETAIKKAILTKVKDQLNLDYSDFEEFKSQFPHFTEEERNKIKEIIRTLTIVDPAVGSGHFLVSALNVLLKIWFDFGMINIHDKYEIKFENDDIKLYKNNGPFIYRKDAEGKDDVEFQKIIFQAKKEIIENNLFGVDINSKAVEIARLRMWIELLKNAYYKPDETMETLPNIDINIKVGDSLLAPIVEVHLFLKQETLAEYKRLFKEYQEATDKQKRKEVREKLKQMREEIVKSRTLEERYTYDKLIWNVDFPHTLNENGGFEGFDVVIANPPYIQLQSDSGRLANLYQPLKFEVFERTGDIYELFIEKSCQLLSNKGFLSFITSNKWMRAGYGESLRKFLRNKTTIKIIIDFCGYKVFPEATVDTNILILSKEKPKQEIVNHNIKIDDKVELEFLNVDKDEFINSYNENIIEYYSREKNTMKQNELSYNAFTLADNNVLALKKKIESVGKPLKDWDVKIYRGVLTGFNEAFIIDTKTKDEILSNCKTEEERKRMEEIIKPILRGRDIGKYYYKWAGLWVIIIPTGWTNENRDKEKPEDFIKKTFPSLMQHLKNFEAKAKIRDDQGDYWWELRHCAYYPEFEKEKVVWAETDQMLNLAFVPKGIYLQKTCFMIIIDKPKLIAGLLNSKISQWYIRITSSSLGEKGMSLTKESVEKISLPTITPSNQPIVQQIESLVNKILPAKKQNPQTDTSKGKK